MIREFAIAIAAGTLAVAATWAGQASCRYDEEEGKEKER